MDNAWNIYKAANKSFFNLALQFPNNGLEKQIKLDLLRGAMSAINYEFKNKNTKSIKAIYKEINNICSDFCDEDVFEYVSYNTMNFERKIMLTCLRKKLVTVIMILGLLKKRLINR